EHEMIAGGKQRLARNAADVQTSAAEFLVLFDNGGLKAKLPGADRGDVAARPRTDDNNIKFVHLEIERKFLRILDAFFHFDEERDRFLAINRAMVIAEREIHHWAHLHFAVDRHRSRHDFVHPENAALRRIQNRRAQERAVHAAV